MSMKKILMAAVAVSALSAGAASALTLSNASTVGSKALAVPSGVAAGYEAYSVASEVAVSATDLTSTVLTFTPDTVVPAGTYVVTYTITGGKFKVATVAPSGVTATGTATATISSVSDTQVVVSYVNPGALTYFTLGSDILVGTAKTPITVSASVATPGGTVVDGGSTAAATVLDYRSGFTFVATKANLTLALADGFKKFGTGAVGTNASSGNLATAVGVIASNGYLADGITLSTDRIWADFAATVLNPTSLISGVVLKLGGDLSAFKFTSGAAAADAGTPDTLTAAGAVLIALRQDYVSTTYVAQAGTVGLATATVPLVGSESAYTVTPTVTMATPATWAAPVFAAKTIGSVSYQGTTFYAPWFGDGSNGISYTVRLSNAGATAIPFVQLKLASPFVAATSGTVAGTVTCSVGTVPAKGELLITSAMAASCFGGFKRGDLTVITGNASTAATTAKMRATAVNGTVTEVSLGTGASTGSSTSTSTTAITTVSGVVTGTTTTTTTVAGQNPYN